MSTSDPLIVTDDTHPGDRGKRVLIACREPSACMTGKLHGPSALVGEAVTRLEDIHQAAHRITP